MTATKNACMFLLVYFFFFSSQAPAMENSHDKFSKSETMSSVLKSDEDSLFKVKSDYAYFGDVWRPLVSMVIPGFDQYLNRQYRWGLGYTVTSIGAWAWAIDASERINSFEETDEYLHASAAERDDWIENKDGPYREQRLAENLALKTGFMSAYHSFRTAARSRQQFGEYAFLDVKYEEPPQKILTEPFNFSYLKRPTTWGWLAAAAACGILQSVIAQQSGDYTSDSYTFEDATYAFGNSFLAGTGEEALFRGYLMPVLREYTNSFFIANISQTAIFTIAHSGTFNPVVLGFGYYHGWLTRRNNWQIGESVFNHFWTDFVFFSLAYTLRKDHSAATIMLPLISFSF